MLLLYDGLCPLCNGAVRFILRHDRRGAVRFAPLESAAGREARRRHGVPDDADSLVLLVDGIDGTQRALLRSDAVLALLDVIGGLWSVLLLFRVAPRPFRDALYSFIARRRYRWFGRYDACPLPPTEHRSRFPE